MLTGKNVLLRPIARTDLTNFLKWFNDPEVVQYLGLHLPVTEMAEEKYIEEVGTTRARTDTPFVIEKIEDDKTRAIGTVGLHGINNKDHNATFGIAIGEKDCWSRGYGTEAARLIIDYGFRQLNLHRVSSLALSFNERSIRMHLKLGFKEEGRQREHLFRNGSYCDHVMFGLLRNEWKNSKNFGE